MDKVRQQPPESGRAEGLRPRWGDWLVAAVTLGDASARDGTDAHTSSAHSATVLMIRIR